MKSTRNSCYSLMKLEFNRHIFDKYSKTKFRKTPSNGSRVVPCGRTEGQTDMTKSVVAFRRFAIVPNKRLGTQQTVSRPIFYQTQLFFLYHL
jgi:hypothetical protein